MAKPMAAPKPMPKKTMKGAIKKVAAKWFHYATRNLIVVKRGTGAGSTKSLSYGKPKSAYATFAEAKKAAQEMCAC